MSKTNTENLTSICRDIINNFSSDNELKDTLAVYLAHELEKRKVTVMPYQIGDKLYRANSWLDQVDELTVSMITQKKDGSWKIRTSSSIYKTVQDFSLENIADPKYDIYADKDEAEIAHKAARAARFEALMCKVQGLATKKS